MNIYKVQSPEGKRLIIAKNRTTALDRIQYLHSKQKPKSGELVIQKYNVSIVNDDCFFKIDKVPFGRMKLLLHCWNCWEWNHDNQLHNCAKCMKLLLEKKKAKNISVFANRYEKKN